MIKKELKKARVTVGAEMAEEVSLPITLSALALDMDKALISEEPREQMRKMTEQMLLSVDVTGLSELRGYENIALCLEGLCGGCRVRIGDRTVAAWDSAPGRVLLPLVGREDFTLEICFPAREVPTDVGIIGGVQLIAFAEDLIADVYTEQLHKNDRTELFVRVRTLCQKENEIFATLYSPSGEMYYIGFVNGEGRTALSDVQRFLPGSGAHGLYRLAITLYRDGTPIDSYETHIGFRKLGFSKGGDGIPFAMTVDNAPFFVKAARISAHPALHIKDSLDGFARALPAFVKMGGNTLFATCESGFLEEEVYALCDRFGVFVFQQLPAPRADAEDLGEYFAQLKSSICALAHHPSLALLVLPDGVMPDSEVARSIKGFFSFAFPFLQVRGLPCPGFAPIAHLPSMPSPISVRRFLPMEARRIFSYTMESAQDSDTQLVTMLGEAAKEYPYGASLDDVCYITALSSAERAERAISEELARGIPGGILVGTLFEGGISMKPSLMDALLQKKALYYDLKKAFSPLFLHARASGETVDIELASADGRERSVTVVTRLADRSNCEIRTLCDDVTVPVGARLCLKKSVPEARGHEREYYASVTVLEEGCPILEKTALFVPAKHFRFVYPGIRCEIKGSGKNYEITLSASAYVRGLRLSFSKMAAEFGKNYFDITSDAKILIPVETEAVTTGTLLETQLRLRSLYDVGRFTEQDLRDGQDMEA